MAHDGEIKGGQVDQFGLNPAQSVQFSQQEAGHERTAAAHAARAEQ